MPHSLNLGVPWGCGGCLGAVVGADPRRHPRAEAVRDPTPGHKEDLLLFLKQSFRRVPRGSVSLEEN